jgi:hypothetical protein
VFNTSTSNRLASSCSGSSSVGSLATRSPSAARSTTDRSPRLGPRRNRSTSSRWGRTRKLSGFIEAIASRSTPATFGTLVAVRRDGVESLDQLQAGREDLLAQRRRHGAVGRDHLLAEVLQVLTEVEHVELGLVVAGPEQVGAQPGAAPNICQNLVFDRTILKNTRLAHSGTSMPVSIMSTEIAMCGAFSGTLKLSIKLPGVLHAVGDHPGEPTVVELRVVGDEPLVDEVGVALVLGEDDRLAQPVAARHLDAVPHQHFQHLVYGVDVEQKLVELGRVHPVGRVQRVAVFVLTPVEQIPIASVRLR